VAADLSLIVAVVTRLLRDGIGTPPLGETAFADSFLRLRSGVWRLRKILLPPKWLGYQRMVIIEDRWNR
jgi:hypothetical protein